MADDVWDKSAAGLPAGVYGALAAVMADLGGIDKSERNTEQNFNFRSIDAIAGAVRPLLGKHGLAIIPTAVNAEYGEVESRRGARGFRCVATVDYRIGHTDGSWVAAQMVGEAVDYGDKSTSKAVQMAYKYLLTELFTVGAGDRDPDGHTPDEMGSSLSDGEIAQRATNRLKAAVIDAADGDKELARSLYSDAVSNHGYGFDDVIPAELHDGILADVEQALADQPEREDTELTDEERAELEAAIAARQTDDASALPFTEETE